jgi:hypothetical protein
MPEVAVADRLRAEQVSDVDIRLFITFTAAMDRARDADRLWQASGSLFMDHRWIFDPNAALLRPAPELMNMLRLYRVSQRHSVDTASWRTIAESLGNPIWGKAVRRAIFEGRGDAQELLYALTAKRENGQPCFPLLQGPKIGVMWVRMLAYPGSAKVTGIETLPVAVDVQVRKVTEYLGMTHTYGQDLQHIRRPIQERWAEDVRLHGAEGPDPLADTPSALDPALWFYGKWGCTRCERAQRKLPISQICGDCRFDRLRRKLEKP